MGSTHPELFEDTLVRASVGRRYEITSESAYVRSARLVFARSSGPSSYPFNSFENITNIQAVLHTMEDRDSELRRTERLVLSINDDKPEDDRQFLPEESPRFANGIYVDVLASEDLQEGAEMLVWLEVRWVGRNDLCPAQQPVDEWRKACGVADAPQGGPMPVLEPWTEQGSRIQKFLMNPAGNYLSGPNDEGLLRLETNLE